MRTVNSTMALHIDCDNLWAYENEYSIPTSNKQARIYEESLARFLEIAEEISVKLTFFIIGDDLQLSACRQFCEKAIKAGHKIANHTLTHPVKFTSMSGAEIADEIRLCDEKITQALGIKAIGFRAPGYYLSQDTLVALRDLGYRYDSSVLPGFSHYLMYLYQYINGGVKSGKAFGRAAFIFASRGVRQFPGGNPNSPLYELPVATFPYLRFPIHMTFAFMLGNSYLKHSLEAIKKNKSHHIFLFHAIDLLNKPVDSKVGELPTFKYSVTERESMVREVMRAAKEIGNLLTEDYVCELDALKIPKTILLDKCI